jgi:hypothetical protein
MNDFYTYAYLREDKTPYYIGKGKENRSRVNCGRSIHKPSEDRILILKKNLTEEEAFKHEIYMIAVLGRKDLGTGILRNRTNGGEGTSGRICTEETREKLKKLRHTIETKKRLRDVNLGRIISPEHRAKISKALLGRKLTDETKRKIGVASKSRVLSDDARTKIANTLRGTHRPEEVRLKLRAQTLGRKWWINSQGQLKHQIENPGPLWQNGRKWRTPDAN